MSNKYAVYFDGGYVSKILKPVLKKNIDISDLEMVLSEIVKSPELKSKELLRAYYYDSPPFKGDSKNPDTNTIIDFGKSDTYKRQISFHEAIKFHSDLALRYGDLKFRGWKQTEKGNHIPDFQQKGVDVKIALDIAQMSMKGILDTVVLFSGDIDITPALKLARKEGVRVYFVNLLNVRNTFIGNDIKIHSDGAINIKIDSSYKKNTLPLMVL